MKIYTRTGDQGQTSLLGGLRVSKDSLRIDAYGTVDELNSHLGLLRDQLNGSRDALLVPIQGYCSSALVQGWRVAQRNRRIDSRSRRSPRRTSHPWNRPWTKWTANYRRCATSYCLVDTSRYRRPTCAERSVAEQNGWWSLWRRARKFRASLFSTSTASATSFSWSLATSPRWKAWSKRRGSRVAERIPDGG